MPKLLLLLMFTGCELRLQVHWERRTGQDVEENTRAEH